VVKDLTPPGKAEDENLDPNTLSWYGFESLTYIPFDHRLIDRDRLDDCQREWLHHYNDAIVAKLSPAFSPEEIAWLKDVCTI
jgi:Xaa-Pro aminopeptidase